MEQLVWSPSHVPDTASARQHVSRAIGAIAVWPSQSHHQYSALLCGLNGA